MFFSPTISRVAIVSSYSRIEIERVYKIVHGVAFGNLQELAAPII